MTALLLSLHVLAAIVAIGPITVAASMFPRYVRPPGEGVEGPPERDRQQAAALLHRICRGYTVLGVAVPVFGVATGARLGVLTDAWLLASIVLTVVAAALLTAVILPGQRSLLEPAAVPERATRGDIADVAGRDVAGAGAAEDRRSAAARLAMTTGVFNLLWAAVVVLMIVRPGSTTGV
ncbi:hypothetical protein EAO71_04175 [Streptomyces sp. ms191]|uniref:hypothetical protein n=1 Tax=Streptomyces sp. ms191 TaxID=1827978 RepID=UPI0011CD621F|nr:hypothetical protein [Streptomyces sp. ms191]TXS32747.1 hypothetical protein EAO71_04175 [Streptomyces sp. ms191]